MTNDTDDAKLLEKEMDNEGVLTSDLQSEESENDEIRPTDIVFDCPHCGHNLAIDYRGAGLQINCVACGRQALVPIPDGMKIDDLDLSSGELLTQLFQTRRMLVKSDAKAALFQGTKYAAAGGNVKGTAARRHEGNFQDDFLWGDQLQVPAREAIVGGVDKHQFFPHQGFRARVRQGVEQQGGIAGGGKRGRTAVKQLIAEDFALLVQNCLAANQRIGLCLGGGGARKGGVGGGAHTLNE